jgi:hypothetical protein
MLERDLKGELSTQNFTFSRNKKESVPNKGLFIFLNERYISIPKIAIKV